MEGGGAAAVLQVLIQNLINVSKDEISLIRGLKKEAEKLKETLATIQSYLDDAEKKFITDKAIKRWLKKLEDVAFNADNVLDELNYDELSKTIMETMETKKKKVISCFPSFDHYAHQRKMAIKIKNINTTFESLKKEAVELGLESILANAPAPPNAGEETNSFTLDPVFIGRDNDVLKIVEMLTNISTKEMLSILPIVGMGGLGKTTLTRKVFNDEKIKTHFGQHIWVHVSAEFDQVSLFKKILTTLTPDENVEAWSSDTVLKKLQDALRGRTYLIVLDDVWNRNEHKWDGFKNSFSGVTSIKGNAIIVTTRNTEVASIVQTLPIYELQGLQEDSCWSIIKAKLLEKEIFR